MEIARPWMCHHLSTSSLSAHSNIAYSFHSHRVKIIDDANLANGYRYWTGLHTSIFHDSSPTAQSRHYPASQRVKHEKEDEGASRGNNSCLLPLDRRRGDLYLIYIDCKIVYETHSRHISFLGTLEVGTNFIQFNPCTLVRHNNCFAMHGQTTYTWGVKNYHTRSKSDDAQLLTILGRDIARTSRTTQSNRTPIFLIR